MKRFKESELILNPDGSIYHLKLLPDHIADKIIVVGDPGRVLRVSSRFSRIDHKIDNREFVTHTGWYNGERMTVLSTGIGTDNIDIVMNELDALVNIELAERIERSKHTSLQIIRLGTSGSLQPDIAVDSFVASSHGMGFDGLLNFYNYDDRITDDEMSAAFMAHTEWGERLPYPYVVAASSYLMESVAHDMKQGVTLTANGFYAPQGRELRAPLAYPGLNDRITTFEYRTHRITNFEMETSALYGLGKMLGHQTLTVCAIIANRIRKEYSKDHNLIIDELISLVLDRFSSIR